MRVAYKGLSIAALQVLLVSSLWAKYLVDRARLPRVWAPTASYDPNMPIRGRYISLELVVQLSHGATLDMQWWAPAELKVENGQLVAVPKQGEEPTGLTIRRAIPPPVVPPGFFLIRPPVAFFISEHTKDPSRRTTGEELWVEVSVPRRGPPRPIRLGVKKNGVLTPLAPD